MTSSATSIAGWSAIVLAGDELEATVLPDKGAEIHSLFHRPSGTELLFHAPWGLQPPGAPPREGAGGHPFLEHYAGGWQELFPSANDSTEYRGEAIPFHGEVASLPWECRPDGDALRCSVRCVRTPFRLERVMRLEDGTLVLDERVSNEGARPAQFVWGHHLVLGPPFIERGCVLEIPARTLETVPELWEETARLEPGQREPWPAARLRAGGTVDLTEVPGPEAASHDDVYVTDLDDGWASVTNPRLGLRLRVDFDATVFRWVIAWQPYGGAHAMPLSGAYALGVEPWVSRLPLGEAAAQGEAIELAPGASFETSLRVGVETVDRWLR
ncbi:MAG: aldose 1-epimerase [Gaiellaceae bacterium]